jgi:hypothetical protein
MLIQEPEAFAGDYFFLPFAFALVAEPLLATLLARDGVAEAGEALLLTASSALFCVMSAFILSDLFSGRGGLGEA